MPRSRPTIRWVRVQGDPSLPWHVEGHPVEGDASLIAVCGEGLGDNPDDLERAGFGVVVGHRCAACQAALLGTSPS